MECNIWISGIVNCGYGNCCGLVWCKVCYDEGIGRVVISSKGICGCVDNCYGIVCCISNIWLGKDYWVGSYVIVDYWCD